METDTGKTDRNRKVQEALEKLAAKRGQSVDEVRASFEAVIDKFCSDGEQGRAALKFLGFDERPTVDEFIFGLAANPELARIIRMKAGKDRS